MADSFNEAIKVEDELVERDLRLYIRALEKGTPLPDFDKAFTILRKLAIKNGISKKNASAWARLRLLEIKRLSDTETDGSTRA